MKIRSTLGFYLLLIVSLIGLLGRLTTLQLFESKYYESLAENNRVKLELVRADRGIFFDRHGEALVYNTVDGREYTDGKALASVLGYVREVSKDQLDEYSLGDMIGKMGLEKEYDANLRGVDGGILIERGADGQVVREMGRKEPVTGKNIKLSLDLGLQKKAFELMAGRKGAVVVSDPSTGEILAMVSSPSFDPDNLEKSLIDPDLPLFNRAVGGEYPPASVFKVVTALAGLEEGKVDAQTEVEDEGEIKVGQFRYGNWYFDKYGRTEGKINIVRALARSNDIFFYKLGEWLGAFNLSDWAKYLGLGVETGIDFPGEANGLIPNPDWKQEYIGESWYLGDTYITAIGQGNILVTPLQLNQMMSVVASRGNWCRPHFNLELENTCKKLDISQNNIELVTEGLKQVVNTGGTAWPLFDFKVKGRSIAVTGKTGTAEFGASESEKTHAWFSGFAPVENPQLVVTVLLEGAGEGSDEAAPVARDLFNYWFSRQ